MTRSTSPARAPWAPRCSRGSPLSSSSGSFPAELRELRARAGVSLAQLAGRAGLSLTYVADLEAGRRGARPSLDVLERLAGALEVPADSFYLYRQLVVAANPAAVDQAYRQLLEGAG